MHVLAFRGYIKDYMINVVRETFQTSIGHLVLQEGLQNRIKGAIVGQDWQLMTNVYRSDNKHFEILHLQEKKNWIPTMYNSTTYAFWNTLFLEIYQMIRYNILLFCDHYLQQMRSLSKYPEMQRHFPPKQSEFISSHSSSPALHDWYSGILAAIYQHIETYKTLLSDWHGTLVAKKREISPQRYCINLSQVYISIRRTLIEVLPPASAYIKLFATC